MPHTAHETPANCVRLGRIGWRVEERDPDSLYCMVEQRTVLAVIIADQKPWTVAKRDCLSNLLGHPGIAGGTSPIDMHQRREPCSMMKKRKIARKNRS